MEMSNRSLALLLVAAIIISLGGTMISLNKLNQQGVTGLALGRVELSVTSNAACTVDSNVSFGSAGQVVSSTTLSSDKANSPFTDCSSGTACSGLQVNNSGNVNLTINMTSNVTGATLLAGQTGVGVEDFQFAVKSGIPTASPANGTDSACLNLNPLDYTWMNVNATNSTICTKMLTGRDTSMMTIEYNITIEPDLAPGPRSAGITIACGESLT